MYAVNNDVIKIDGLNGAGGKLIDVLQFQGVFAYFQISGRYLTNFKISGGHFRIWHFTQKNLCIIISFLR
jgi:hypothetical protein